MHVLLVQIDRFVDEHQPGFVECSLIDSSGKTHLFLEKVSVVTSSDLWSGSQYPQPGVIACQVERKLQGPEGETLVQVNTELPWHVESTAGETWFIVRASQVRSENAA
jgi:hypothetical protein